MQLPCIVEARLAVQSNSHLSTSLSCPLTPIRSRIVEPPYSGGSQNKNAMECSPDPFFPDPMTKEKKGSGYARLSMCAHNRWIDILTCISMIDASSLAAHKL